MRILRSGAIALLAMAVTAQSQAATLTVTLSQDGGEFSLGAEMAVNAAPVTDERLLHKQWQVDANTLNPAFPTQRFECVIYNKADVDGCSDWRDQEDRFVYINRFQSDYGDTPAEREAKAAKSSIGSKVIGVAQVVTVGAVVAPLAVVLVPMSLLVKATESTTNKWVEFNHDEFSDAVTAAVRKAGFTDIEAFKLLTRRVNEEVAQAEKLSAQALAEVNARLIADKTPLKAYVKAGLKSDAHAFVIKPYALPNGVLSQQAEPYLEQHKAKIDAYYQAAYAAFKDQLSKDLIALEGPYQAYLAKVAKEAKAREKQLQAERAEAERQAKEAERQAKEDAKRARQEAEQRAKELASFRHSLQVGDPTFCGHVIEMKLPMIRISLDVQLAGYGSDKWLRIEDVYPPSVGCQNTNGRLSPY